MNGRTITKKQMADLAWLLLKRRNDCGFKFDNPNVFWETIVDSSRSRVRIYGNYMLMMDMTRQNLLASATFEGIYP